MLNSGILYTENGIMYFVYAQTLSYFLSAVTAFFIILKHTHSFKLKWNWPFSLMILKKSLPYAVLILLMSFYNRIDSVMIERMLPNGDVQAGIYAQGFRILDAANMIGFLVAGVLMPVFSRMLKEKESIEPLLKLISRLLLTPAIVVGIGSMFYRTELIGLLYPIHVNETLQVYESHLNESSLIFGLLMLSFTAFSCNYIFGTLLTSNGNLRQMNYLAGFCMLLNVSLNYFLIQKFEAIGSAIASLGTQFLMAFLQLMLAKRIFNFKVNYKLINIFAMFIIGVVAINYASKMLPFNWMVSFSGMVLFCGLWAFITGIISIKSIFRLLKYG
jgi:O-antigen/teichoic acid export membrane protein